jgi:Zn-dependent peptidase ImmA (M78 family)
MEALIKLNTSPDYSKARTKAQEVLSRFGLTQPPIDPERIAEDLGIDVVYVNFNPEVSNEISGFYDFSEKRIYINKEINPRRMIFTIAHELGHALMHEDYAASDRYQVMPRTNYHMNKPAEEKEADVFAASLLVPPTILKKYKNYADIEELSTSFMVSTEVIANQLKYT